MRITSALVLYAALSLALPVSVRAQAPDVPTFAELSEAAFPSPVTASCSAPLRNGEYTEGAPGPDIVRVLLLDVARGDGFAVAVVLHRRGEQDVYALHVAQFVGGQLVIGDAVDMEQPGTVYAVERDRVRTQSSSRPTPRGDPCDRTITNREYMRAGQSLTLVSRESPRGASAEVWMLCNGTYPSTFTASGSVTLVGGQGRGWGHRGPGVTRPNPVSTHFRDALLTPHFAVVRLDTSLGGSGTAHSIQLAQVVDGVVIAGRPVVLGWNVRDGLRVSGDRLRVEMLVHGPDDHKLKPAWPLELEFTRSGLELVLASASQEPPRYGYGGALALGDFPRPLTPGATAPPVPTQHSGLAATRDGAVTAEVLRNLSYPDLFEAAPQPVPLRDGAFTQRVVIEPATPTPNPRPSYTLEAYVEHFAIGPEFAAVAVYSYDSSRRDARVLLYLVEGDVTGSALVHPGPLPLGREVAVTGMELRGNHLFVEVQTALATPCCPTEVREYVRDGTGFRLASSEAAPAPAPRPPRTGNAGLLADTGVGVALFVATTLVSAVLSTYRFRLRRR